MDCSVAGDCWLDGLFWLVFGWKCLLIFGVPRCLTSGVWTVMAGRFESWFKWWFGDDGLVPKHVKLGYNVEFTSNLWRRSIQRLCFWLVHSFKRENILAISVILFLFQFQIILTKQLYLTKNIIPRSINLYQIKNPFYILFD